MKSKKTTLLISAVLIIIVVIAIVNKNITTNKIEVIDNINNKTTTITDTTKIGNIIKILESGVEDTGISDFEYPAPITLKIYDKDVEVINVYAYDDSDSDSDVISFTYDKDTHISYSLSGDNADEFKSIIME